VSIIGDGHILGKGELRLVDSETNTYQSIKIIAWYDLAQRLELVPEASWISILTSYAPSEFMGRVDDQFSVGAFHVL